MRNFLTILAITSALTANAFGKTEPKTTTFFDSSTAATTAQTQYGKICGYIDRDIYTYKGVPYAKAARFMDPEAPDAWEGIRSCRWWGPVCPQPQNTGWKNDQTGFFYRWNDGFQDEDCLRLNIWTPSIQDNGKRPVIVWLHGGGFYAGNGQEHPGYDGRNLAAKGDAVVISLNHRLNVLGYLDLSLYGKKYAHSGNVGMLDIVAALRWIKENISQFGGDPNNVTIFGQSGGGGKVSTLLCMPAAKGLFQRAMIMSGSGIKGMDHKIAQETGRLTIENLGLKAENVDQIQTMPYGSILNAAQQAMKEVSSKHANGNSYSRGFMWGPINDGEVLKGIFEFGSESQTADVPLIIGCTLNEFSVGKTPKGVTNWDEAEKSLSGSMGAEKAKAFIAAFRETYPNDPVDAIFRLDQTVRPNAIRQANIRVADGGAPVWMYQFGYQLPTMDGDFHACHNSDIAFFFDNVMLSAPMTGATKEGIALGEEMSSYLLNFARYGNPNGKGLLKWEEYTPEKGATMFFNRPSNEVRYHHDANIFKALGNGLIEYNDLINDHTAKQKNVDDGGSGSYKAIAVTEESMPEYVIYRPISMAYASQQEHKLPILIWGNGACANTSAGYERMLTEIASSGYLVIAIGTMQQVYGDRKDGSSESRMMKDAMDWICAQARDRNSEYYDCVDTTRMAAGGHSCGGAQTLANAGDRRLSTYLICNAGMGDMEMAGASKASLKNLHGPILYLIGGKEDVAYNNALLDYDRIEQVPVALADHANAGHGGTYRERAGGEFGKLALIWLNWQLKGRGKGGTIFLGSKIEDFPNWALKHKNFSNQNQ